MAISVEHSVTAACTPQHAWKAFNNLERWPGWNPVVAEARWLEGAPWQAGSRFRLELARPANLTLEPVITEAAPPHRIAWDGSGPLLSGRNEFTFQAQPDGATLLRVTGEFSGFGTMFWGDRLQRAVTEMFAEWLDALKAEAEKTASSPAP